MIEEVALAIAGLAFGGGLAFAIHAYQSGQVAIAEEKTAQAKVEAAKETRLARLDMGYPDQSEPAEEGDIIGQLMPFVLQYAQQNPEIAQKFMAGLGKKEGP